MAGTVLTTAFAAIVKFAVLPGVETYLVFCLAIGIVLVPAGALMAQPRQAALFMAMAANFVPLLAPTNPMSFDTQQFYNSALAIVAGVGAAVVSFRLLPPLPPALRARRLLALTRRDMRRLTRGPIPRTAYDWESLTFARLSVLPEEAEPGQAGQLLAALSVGSAIIRLRRIAKRLDLDVEFDAVLDAVARGECGCDRALARLDQKLAALPGSATAARSACGRAEASLNVRGPWPTRVVFRCGSASMRFTEIDLFDVYVAPMWLSMVAAWLIVLGLRRGPRQFGDPLSVGHNRPRGLPANDARTSGLCWRGLTRITSVIRVPLPYACLQ